MRKFLTAAASVFALMAVPAQAQEAGDIQIKVLGTAVLPDGKIKQIPVDPGLPADLQTKANDNFVPTLAIEYFMTDNVSIETICCMTQHDVDATTGLPGAELVSNAKLIPATFTAKYHLNSGGISPYVGVGATYFLWVSDKPGAATVNLLNVDRFKLSNELGFVAQAGVDVPLNENMAVTLDAKRYWVDAKAHWYVGDTELIQTKHQLDPWVLSAGVAFRF